jgi:hypothetical protein
MRDKACYIPRKKSSKSSRRDKKFEVYEFEALDSWLKRKGTGKPDPKKVEQIEGPVEMTLVMDINQLIQELVALERRST